MLITSVEPQKRNKNRINLYLDGVFYCGLSLETAVKCRLKTGREIEREELEGVVLESEKRNCFDSGLKYVSRKMCTEKEIRTHLNKKEFLPAAVDYAIEKLLEYKYINDGEYAKSYVNYSSNRGILKIKFDLKNKGIDESIIDEALTAVIDNQFNVCKETAEKYLSKKELNYKTKVSLFRYLVSKGFEQDIINQVVRLFKVSDE